MPLDALQPYLNELASAAPAPGGGAAAAVTVAQGLALLEMVGNLTVGKKKFAAVESETRSLLDRATALRAQALALMEADMVAFNKVMDAYRMLSETEAQADVKREALTAATRAAAEPPYRLMQLAADALPLADRLEQIGNPNVLSDVLVGRILLLAGLQASRENVEVNLRSLPPEDYCVVALRAGMRSIAPHCG